jgi:hypothetical protein
MSMSNRSLSPLLAACVAGLALLALGTASKAAELVLVTRDGCPWCARFEREVGPIYPRTEEGRQAPLRRITLEPGGSVLAGARERVFAAPTFILFDQGREVGRITGYAGDDAFWGLLGKMLAGIASEDHKEGGETRQMGLR